MKLDLGTQVATAVGSMLAGRHEITLDEIIAALPAHLVAARPSPRAMTKALFNAGWIGVKAGGGKTLYRSPDAVIDELEGAEPGHNAMADELAGIIGRVRRLREERKGIGDDIKDVLAEAKGRGYDPKAINKVVAISEKKKEEWHEDEAILEVYLRATGMM